MVEKQKLTLSVDKKVVQKAKDAGLNISEITEKLLRSYTIEIENIGKEELHREYKELIDLMWPLMQKHGVNVNIGWDVVDEYEGKKILAPIVYTAEGILWNSYSSKVYEEISDIDSRLLDSPTKILHNFLEGLTRIDEISSEKIRELEMSKRILRVVAEYFAER